MLSDPKLAQAAMEEAKKRANEFFEGVYKYKLTHYQRDIVEPPCVFQLGNARLIGYGCSDSNAPVVLLIPSLINRYHILDLTEKLSFARYLRDEGMRVFIVDWGSPGEREQHFGCGLYVTETLVPMVEWIIKYTGHKLILGGYCMGGILSLALAQIRSDLIKGIALFATPWDFSDPHFPRIALPAGGLQQLEQYINGCDEFPAAIIHNIFHRTNPYAYQNKLREFSKMPTLDELTQEFLSIEHWVNDGVAMTKQVAHDCFIRWPAQNALVQQQWHVGGQIINPRLLKIPSFCAVPLKDKVVPRGCALPLLEWLKFPEVVTPRTGHIGMIVGRQRSVALWRPFKKWIYSQFT